MFSFTNIRVGWFLALRQVRGASLWTNALIVFVMLLTFLNLVVVTGVLVGLVQGISNLYRQQETGDVFISTLANRTDISNSPEVTSLLKGLPEVKDISARYVAGGMVQANYQTPAAPGDKPNETAANIVGVDPVAENAFSNISKFVGEGQYLAPGDYDQILIGSQLIDRYAFGGDLLPNISALKNVYPGTKVRVTIGSVTREMTVKGIIITTANSPLASKVIMPAGELRTLLDRSDYAVNQIAVNLVPGTNPTSFTTLLKNSGVGDVAQVRTFDQAVPSGVAEVESTFASIGNAIGSIGLVVAAVTIFIVIFINAITRRKFIGILKGIGISGEAIEISYILQSLFYAIIGSGIGLAVVYGFLVPYFAAHPIVLPISNAIIVAPITGTMLRVLLLVVTTAIAGYVPARIIVRKNTLDSILGRN